MSEQREPGQWWHASYIDDEVWSGSFATREEAEADRRRYDPDAPFALGRASRQPWRTDIFDDALIEAFNSANEELAPDTEPAEHAKLDVHGRVPQDLREKLEVVLVDWLKEHGNPTACAPDFHDMFEVEGTERWRESQKTVEAARAARLASDAAEIREGRLG